MIHGLGTLLNTATVLAGATIGLTVGRVIPASLHQTVRAAIGEDDQDRELSAVLVVAPLLAGLAHAFGAL